MTQPPTSPPPASPPPEESSSTPAPPLQYESQPSATPAASTTPSAPSRGAAAPSSTPPPYTSQHQVSKGAPTHGTHTQAVEPPPPYIPPPSRSLDGWPAFIREMDATLAVQSQYVLWGNLHDSFLIPDPITGGHQLVPLRELLWQALWRSGYAGVVCYDQVDGVQMIPHGGGEGKYATSQATRLLGKKFDDRSKKPSLEKLTEHMGRIARPSEMVRCGFIIDYASRIPSAPTKLSESEKDFFVFCEKLSRTASPVRSPESPRPKPLYNPIIWLVEKPGDLPPWLNAGNDMIREIAIPFPHLGERATTSRLLARAFGVNDVEENAEAAEICTEFAKQSDGMGLQSMIEATRLAKDRGMRFDQLPDAVQTYKLGVLDNPWKRGHLRKRISKGESEVGQKVVGQDQAVTKTLDILKRSVLGLSGAQASQSSRPRGVLFFAGPTGTGKTELAKTVTNLVFGDSQAYIRFDMSEFSSEHAGDRLIGAPPGYVGFEAGGELTNAIREDPFRVVLFDEIEKAHPRILDKFLQILDDGRLSDGRGNTCHFSESILIFTSNLGMFVENEHGRRVQNVTQDMPYEEMEHRLRDAITDHFTTTLNRPELLNRFGDNIVIFNFISPEAAGRIFSAQLNNICKRVSEEHNITLNVAPESHTTLQRWCTSELEKGGRGIGMTLESYFVNPLARKMFEVPFSPGGTLTVSNLRREGSIVQMDLS